MADKKYMTAGQLADSRFGIWDMAINFSCDEMDLIEEDE